MTRKWHLQGLCGFTSYISKVSLIDVPSLVNKWDMLSLVSTGGDLIHILLGVLPSGLCTSSSLNICGSFRSPRTACFNNIKACDDCYMVTRDSINSFFLDLWVTISSPPLLITDGKGYFTHINFHLSHSEKKKENTESFYTVHYLWLFFPSKTFISSHTHSVFLSFMTCTKLVAPQFDGEMHKSSHKKFCNPGQFLYYYYLPAIHRTTTTTTWGALHAEFLFKWGFFLWL